MWVFSKKGIGLIFGSAFGFRFASAGYEELGFILSEVFGFNFKPFVRNVLPDFIMLGKLVHYFNYFLKTAIQAKKF